MPRPLRRVRGIGVDLGIDDHRRPRGRMPFAHQRRSSRGEGRCDLQHGTPVDKARFLPLNDWSFPPPCRFGTHAPRFKEDCGLPWASVKGTGPAGAGRASPDYGKDWQRPPARKLSFQVIDRSRACDRAAVPIEIVQPCPLLGLGLPGRRTGVRPDPLSQELTTATASISIMKSGPARRVTPTVVLVGVATPR